jgi:hypothetical protein
MIQPMAHVFIVDSRSFPLHLEYRFAGTYAPTQRNIGLYADIARVRQGHRAYFYLLKQGFYGPFKVDPDNRGVWWDRLNPTFLEPALGRRLIYRVQVVTDDTYPLVVPEWDALDRYLREPTRCLWSLVYRKLKGARGCTMIFPWEDNFLLALIKESNEKRGRTPLRLRDGEHVTWNAALNEIEILAGGFSEYAVPSDDHVGMPEDPLLGVLLERGGESHLQAFLTKNYGSFPDSEIVFGRTETVTWVGNEVACGLGMQKIDLFVINEDDNGPLFRIIELKKDPPDERTVWQLARYIEWTKRFVPDAESNNIQPVLLCRNLFQMPLSHSTKQSFKEFNDASSARPLKYIECAKSVDPRKARFYEVSYL